MKRKDAPQAETFDLLEYAGQARDEKMKTFDEIRADIIDSGSLNRFKEELKKRHKKGQLNLVVGGTGGTFQSAETDKGLAPEGSLQHSFEAMRLPYNSDEIHLNLLELFNYDSALLTTGEHVRFIAEVLIQLLNDCSDWIDGFVITHGTDTMVETANYLSLILGRGLKKPVILTGSQDPARKKNSDAIYHMDNCLKVHEFLRDNQVAEVMVLCGDELVRGAWAQKKSDKDSNAVESFNNKPLLRVANKLVKRWELADFALQANATVPFIPFNGVLKQADIPVTKLADLSPEALAKVIVGNRVSVFTLLGSSTCPNTHADIMRKASEHGKGIVLRSPFHDAVLKLGTYQAGSALAGSRMPQVKGTESFIRAKLNWLWHYLDIPTLQQAGVGEVLSLEQQARLYTLMSQNIVGEWDGEKAV